MLCTLTDNPTFLDELIDACDQLLNTARELSRVTHGERATLHASRPRAPRLRIEEYYPELNRLGQ